MAIVADGLVAEARRPAEEAPAVGQAQAAEAPRYAPGAVLRIYAAADGSYQQFMTVEGFGEMHGLPAYTGKLWTFAQGAWATRASTYFCQRIDRYARPAEPGDLPENPS